MKQPEKNVISNWELKPQHLIRSVLSPIVWLIIVVKRQHTDRKWYQKVENQYRRNKILGDAEIVV